MSPKTPAKVGESAKKGQPALKKKSSLKPVDSHNVEN
jgi:hypothetical protein